MQFSLLPDLCCRYLLRVTMTGKGMVADTKKDAPFWVRNYDVPPDEAPPIKMEVRGRLVQQCDNCDGCAWHTCVLVCACSPQVLWHVCCQQSDSWQA